MRIFNRFMKSRLRVHGWCAQRLRTGKVSGIDFAHDLRVVLDRLSPVCLDVGANVGGEYVRKNSTRTPAFGSRLDRFSSGQSEAAKFLL